ncbi:unnamed protein product [Dovyalis caffra]|uniref:EF-hand domain-containing protein n=1 Tax=Dovyalis caffra TaxID=77055 RepID=A0AAV1S6M7_9ROSI|nr:unnamed protein product [Dovyalis caffra]
MPSRPTPGQSSLATSPLRSHKFGSRRTSRVFSRVSSSICQIKGFAGGFLKLPTRTTSSPKDRHVQDMVCEADQDGNGTLDFEEFLNDMGKKQKKNVTDELKQAFKVFDMNQDGYISVNELRQGMMIYLGQRLTKEEAEQMIREAEQMIREADLDGDDLDDN